MHRELRRTELMEASTRCTLFSLRKASRAITQIYDAALAPSGLKGTQFTLLVGIALAEEPTIAQLAEALVTDRTTLSRNLTPLEKAALIRIETGRDRRSRVVKLSPRGQDRLRSAYPLWKKAQARVIRTLGRARWKGLLGHLSGVVELAHGDASQPIRIRALRDRA